jgi:general secretion pathway protein K
LGSGLYYCRSQGAQLNLKDDSEPAAIINSVKDWLTAAITMPLRDGAARTSYYMDRQPPFGPNTPITDPNDLLLIKGVTPELFYGTAESPHLAPSDRLWNQR